MVVDALRTKPFLCSTFDNQGKALSEGPALQSLKSSLLIFDNLVRGGGTTMRWRNSLNGFLDSGDQFWCYSGGGQ